MTTTRYRVQGITDDVTTCECCGLEGLKRTVRLIELDADGGDVDAVYYGTDCAARAARTSSYRIRSSAGVAENLAESARRWAREALDIFPGMSVSQFIAANLYYAGRPAEAAEALAGVVAEARQILAGGLDALVGTRFERDLRKLPTITARKPARPAAVPAAPAAPAAVVSAVQGALF